MNKKKAEKTMAEVSKGYEEFIKKHTVAQSGKRSFDATIKKATGKKSRR